MKLEPLEASQYYHFYNRGNNKGTIFFEYANYQYFLDLIKKHIIQVADIYSYCLISNHYHLIIRIKSTNNLPDKYKNGKSKIHQAFSNLFNAYAKSINKRYNRVGSLFQKHPKRILIKNEIYLKNLIIYVNTNSSHHQVANYINYEHSSYKTLISNQPTLLKRQDVIDLFNDVTNFNYVLKNKVINMDIIRETSFE